MPVVIVFALLSLLAAGGGDFIFRRAQLKSAVEGGMRAEDYLVIHSSFFTILALIYCQWSSGLALEMRVLPLVVPTSIFSFLSLYLLIRSLRLGSVSTNISMYRLNFIITSLLGILILSEAATTQKFLGLILGFGAVAFFALAEMRLAGRGSGRSGFPEGGAGAGPFLLAGAAMFLQALFHFLMKYYLSRGISLYSLIPPHVVLFNVYVYASAFGRGSFRLTRPMKAHSPVSGLLYGTAFIFLLLAFRAGEASIVAPISQLSFVFSALLAMAFLRESLGGFRLVGLIMAIGAVLTLSR